MQPYYYGRKATKYTKVAFYVHTLSLLIRIVVYNNKIRMNFSLLLFCIANKKQNIKKTNRQKKLWPIINMTVLSIMQSTVATTYVRIL